MIIKIFHKPLIIDKFYKKKLIKMINTEIKDKNKEISISWKKFEHLMKYLKALKIQWINMNNKN